MKLSSWFLLITSAILYALPFIFSSNIWWLIFLFPIPLFYLAPRTNLGFRHGFIWGLIAFSLHFGGILWNVNALCAQSAGLTRLIPAITILSYTSICAGIWFSLNAKIIKWLRLISPARIIAIWASTLWLFIFFFDRLFLWPFDRLEGYFLMHPLLPLAMHPPLLMLMPIIGKNILTLLFCLVPASIALFLVHRNRRSACLIVLTCIPWCMSVFIPTAHARKPAWLDYLVTLSAQFPRMEEPINQALVAQQCFKKLIREIFL